MPQRSVVFYHDKNIRVKIKNNDEAYDIILTYQKN